MYVLHYWPDSASLIVRLVLEELGQPYEARLIDRAAGAQNSPTYRALNPLGQIPAMETPDGPMFETAAILLYLCDRHPGLVSGQGLAPAPGDRDRAEFLKWLLFTSTNIHPTLLQLFYPDRTAGAENAAAVRSHAHARMTTLLEVLEAAGPAVLSASRPTALGYYLAVLLRWIAGDFPSAAYPNLHAMLCHLEARPAALTLARAENLGVVIFSDPD